MPCLSAARCRAFAVSSKRLHLVTSSSTVRLLILLAIVLPVAVNAAVTNYVRVGGGSTGVGQFRWSRAINWSTTNGVPPGSSVGGLTNTDITLAGSLKLTPIMESDYFIRSLIFDTGAGSFTLSSQSAEVLSIGAGGILNKSANTQRF